MNTFELLSLLPAFLDIKCRGKVYHNFVPCIYANGSRVNLAYRSGCRQVLLSERLESQEELEDSVEFWAENLKGLTEYETIKMLEFN